MAERFTPDKLTTDEGERWSSQGVGEVSAGKYEGPEAHATAPWKCPACGVQNEGRLELGCVHCGSGKPGRHIGLPTKESPAFKAVKADMARGLEALDAARLSTISQALERTLYEVWRDSQTDKAFAVTENQAYLEAAFVAGYRAAQRQILITAPPVTADVDELAPEGKVRRTILAALAFFKDQVLSNAESEIASGEWLSVEECERLIAQWQAEGA
jgi:hypothetical protein